MPDDEAIEEMINHRRTREQLEGLINQAVEPNRRFCAGQIRLDRSINQLYMVTKLEVRQITVQWLSGQYHMETDQFLYDECEDDEIMGDTSIKDVNGNVILKDGTVMRIEDGTIMANTSTSTSSPKAPFTIGIPTRTPFVSHALDPVKRQKEVVDKLLKEKQTLDDIEKAVIEEKHILMEKLEIEQALLEQAKKMHKANERNKSQNLSTECATSVDLIGNVE
jgi:hypothetical protein